MSWIILILAGMLEVVGVNGIQRFSQGYKATGTASIILGFAASLGLLSVAMETIPLGIAYAVWTGMGTVGSAILGMVYYNDAKDGKRIMYLSFIIIAVIGLRLVTG